MKLKTQFIINVAVLGALLLLLVVLVRPMINKQQANIVAAAVTARRQLAEKQAQQETLVQAQKSMKALDGKSLKKEDLLPGENQVAGQLALLEGWAGALGLEFKVALSGKVRDAKKGETKSDIAMVPMTVILRGQTSDILAFLKLLEQGSLPFVTANYTIGVDGSSAKTGQIATLQGYIYVKR